MSDEPAPTPPICPLHPKDRMMHVTTNETFIHFRCLNCSIEIDRPIQPQVTPQQP